MLSMLNKLLSLLPFDGLKSKLGLALLLAARSLAAAHPASLAWQIVGQVLDGLGLGLGSIGLVHDVVKRADK